MMYIARIGLDKGKEKVQKNIPLLGDFLRERQLICFSAIAPLFQGMLNLNT
jgi:hypothetical protein